MTYQFLNKQIQGPVAWIEYTNPPRNAVNWEMLQELPSAIRSSDFDPDVRVIVIASGLDRYFSVGADLGLFDGIGQDGMRRWMELCHRLVHEMRRSSKPLLAAINGTAVGAGLEVTLHCDLRFAADSARFGQPEINIGLLPGVGTTQVLAGLVDFVFPAGQLRSEVQSYAEMLSRKPKEALAAIRRTITLGGGMGFDDGLALELEAEIELAGTANFREGIAAFLSKRQPNWQ